MSKIFLKQNIVTTLLYLVSGGSTVLISLIITPDLNKILDTQELEIMVTTLTFAGIGITLCSVGIPNSIVALKLRFNNHEYKNLISRVPFNSFLASLIFAIVVFIIEGNSKKTAFYVLILTFLQINFNTLIQVYQAEIKKWKSFQFSIGFTILFIALYFLNKRFLFISSLDSRFLIPFIIYFIGICLFYLDHSLMPKIKLLSKETMKYVKKIWPHTLFGIILTQIDKLTAINFFETNDSTNYLLSSIYLSPLIMLGIQANNAIKPIMAKELYNSNKIYRLIAFYTSVILLGSFSYYIFVQVYLEQIIPSEKFEFTIFTKMIFILYLINNLYNPWGSLCVLKGSEGNLSKSTFLFATISILSMVFMIALKFEPLQLLICLIIINGLYLLRTIQISNKK